MTGEFDFLWLIGLMGIPSAITAMCFWLLQRQISIKHEAMEKRERVREKNEIILVKSVRAAISLAEAAAIAVKKGSVNGETEMALEYARQVKNEQREFLLEQGIKNIY